MSANKFPLPIGRLISQHEDVQEQEYLLESGIYRIGRLAEVCQIVINRKTVSKIHATIERCDGQFILRDYHSTNGTFVTKSRLGERERLTDEYILKNGDCISLGDDPPLLTFVDSDPTFHSSTLLRYDEKGMLFLLNGQPVELTKLELRLLLHLYQHRNQVCERASCARAIWQNEYSPELETDNLDRAIFHVRRALRRIDPEIDLIKSRRGLGFILEL